MNQQNEAIEQRASFFSEIKDERWQALERRLEELLSYQRDKLLKLAARRVAGITYDDLLQPFDFQELENDPDFRYEEGVLAGIYCAQTALRSEIKASSSLLNSSKSNF